MSCGYGDSSFFSAKAESEKLESPLSAQDNPPLYHSPLQLSRSDQFPVRFVSFSSTLTSAGLLTHFLPMKNYE